MTKEQARKKLALAASKQGLKVQMKSGKVKDAIRILNASGKVVAEGTLALDASKGYVNSDVQKTITQINTKLGKRSMNASRRRKMNCAATAYTEALSPKEEDMIKDTFERYGVDIETTTDATNSDDGILYEEYVVSIHNPDRKAYNRLMEALNKLEDRYDIGYWNDYRSDSGDIRDDIHFFHYPEDTNASKRSKTNASCHGRKKMNASDDEYIKDDAEFVEDVESVVTDEQGNEIVVEEMLVVQNPETNEISLFVPTEEDETVPENVEVIGEVVTADDETTLDSSRKRVKTKSSRRACR